tara:strand:- start:2400 stop:2906 length:507 start_codon:yes stop_codon:yes gene_type:complete
MFGSGLIYASLAMLLLSLADFTIGNLNKRLKPPVSTLSLNFVAYSFMAVISTGMYYASFGNMSNMESFLHPVRKGFTQIGEGKNNILFIIPFVATCYLLGNRFLWTSYKTAPGIGLAEAAYSSNSAVVLILTYFFFGTKVKLVNVVGLILSILGIFLLSGKINIKSIV